MTFRLLTISRILSKAYVILIYSKVEGLNKVLLTRLITPTWHRGNCVKASYVAEANVEVQN